MKRAFTLIELVAVLVILAILALIVTPLVLNIIRKASKSANMRSVDYYGRSTELAIGTYMLDHGKYPNSIDDLTVEYKGKEVDCEIKDINDDGTVYLTKCSVGGKIVYNSSGEYYVYGRLNPNYPVYKVGDCKEEGTYVNYKGSKWCVINDSSRKQDYVTLMKYATLTDLEGLRNGSMEYANRYGIIHYEFRGPFSLDGERFYSELVRYYSSETCGYLEEMKVNSLVETGCTNEYNLSSIKKVVDSFGNNNLDLDDLKEINGYKIRLITKEELENNLYYENNMPAESTPT